jgi:hypothetical protein
LKRLKSVAELLHFHEDKIDFYPYQIREHVVVFSTELYIILEGRRELYRSTEMEEKKELV